MKHIEMRSTKLKLNFLNSKRDTASITTLDAINTLKFKKPDE
jgi:hypothetical protein